MYLKYSVGQRLPVNMEGFMGMKIPCDIEISDIVYKVRAELGNGQFSEMMLTEPELKERIIGNPQVNGKNYYQCFCKYGCNDCVNDPAYIKTIHPEWYEKLGAPTDCPDCDDMSCYDDEDK